GKEDVRLSFALLFRRAGYVLRDPCHMVLQNPQERSPSLGWTACNLCRQGRNRATTSDVVGVLDVEIRSISAFNSPPRGVCSITEATLPASCSRLCPNASVKSSSLLSKCR